ncbi:MAG: SDR family oxidoreductase [Rhodobacteraceae bacterium]|nr:SDR family oxidoreductase [Paracoccaceae bacterium]
MTKSMFIFGAGYTAGNLSKKLTEQGWTVYGTTRRQERFDEIAQSGAHPLLIDDPTVSERLSACSHVLISAGPSENGDPTLNDYRSVFVENRFEWVGYLSTTGVYGGTEGEWVDEETPLHPTTTRGQQRKSAEEAWSEVPNLPLHIFRLAGIYGPGRGPFSKVKSGKAQRIIKKDQVFSRIHVEDIVQVLCASIAAGTDGGVYNVCDNYPAPPQDVIGYAAELLGLPIPPAIAFEDANLSPMGRSFYAENKRVANERIKSELGIALKYPDYKEGLDALIRLEEGL